MNDLMNHGEVKLVERHGEFFLESTEAALFLGITHKSFMETIRKYTPEIEQFGALLLETATRNDGNTGGHQPMTYLLNDDQATFITTLSQNNPKVVAFKLKLVKAFSAAKKIVTNISSIPPRELAMMILRAEDEKERIAKSLSSSTQQLQIANNKIKKLSIDHQIIDNFMQCSGLIEFDNVARIAKIRMKTFNKIIRGLVTREDGKIYANLIQQGKIVIVPKSKDGKAYIDEYFTPKGAVWFYRKYIMKQNDDIVVKTFNLFI